MHSTGIAFILGICDPSAILRHIMVVIIDAVNLQRVVISSGVSPCHKGRKIMPGRVEGNPASSITRIAIMMRIRAALHHAIPDSIETGSSSRTIMAMFCAFCYGLCQTLAPARPRVCQQFECSDTFDGSTVAAACVEGDVIRTVPCDTFFQKRTINDDPKTKARADRNVF